MTTGGPALDHEVRSAITSRSHAARAELLRRLADRLVQGGSRLNPYQVINLDRAICALITRVDLATRVDAATRLAAAATAPPSALNQLARDDIAVARIVLTRSPALTGHDLIHVAQIKGERHLLAISQRAELAVPVTDLIITRAGRSVLKKLASNPGAKFSPHGLAQIIARSAADEELATSIGLRSDLPPEHLKLLLWETTDQVRDRLMASAAPHVKELIEATLATIYRELELSAAERETLGALARALAANGTAEETSVAVFASTRLLREMTATIAVMNGAPVELMSRVLRGPRTDIVLIACRSAGLGWPTVEAVLRNRRGDRDIAPSTIELARQDYQLVSPEAAQLTLNAMQKGMR